MYLLEAGEVDLAGKSHMLSHVKREVGGRIHTFSVVVTSLRCRLSAKFEADVHSRPRPPLSSLYVVKLKTNSFFVLCRRFAAAVRPLQTPVLKSSLSVNKRLSLKCVRYMA